MSCALDLDLAMAPAYASSMLSLDEARALVPTYQRLRDVQRRLNGLLFATISRRGIEESARAIGAWEHGRVVLDDPDDIAVLADFAIHDYRASGKNAVERFARSRAPELNGDDVPMVVHAMLNARFTLVEVIEVLDAAGVHAADLVYGGDIALLDLGLGQTAAPGLTLAARLLPMEGWSMTTGAALPFDPELARLMLGKVGDLSMLPRATTHDRALIARTFIGAALRDPEELKARWPDAWGRAGWHATPRAR